MDNLAARYHKIVYWSNEDNCFIGECPELFYGGVHGDEPTKVFAELLEVIDEWVEIYEADGKTLPEPKGVALLEAA